MHGPCVLVICVLWFIHSQLFLGWCFLLASAGDRSTEQSYGSFVFCKKSICQGAHVPASSRFKLSFILRTSIKATSSHPDGIFWGYEVGARGVQGHGYWYMSTAVAQFPDVASGSEVSETRGVDLALADSHGLGLQVNIPPSDSQFKFSCGLSC